MDNPEQAVSSRGKAVGAPTEAASAYTAGIVDGEGCISIGRQNRKGRWLQYDLFVIVVQKDRRLTDWLYGQWSGYRGTVQRKQGYSPGEYHRWSIHGRRAQDMLRQILPHLRIKDEQARVAIEFQNHKHRHATGKGYSMAETYEPFYLRLRALKRERAAATTESSEPA